jgi:gamma-tubulin complex component 5
MSSNQAWTDFHFLNSAFNDVVDTSVRHVGDRWIEPALVRLSYLSSSSRMRERSVQALDGLLVEYAVPFPLIYIFTPGAMQSYRGLFVALLQIWMVKYVLERILVRGDMRELGNELRAFYALRSRMSWFAK